LQVLQTKKDDPMISLRSVMAAIFTLALGTAALSDDTSAVVLPAPLPVEVSPLPDNAPVIEATNFETSSAGSGTIDRAKLLILILGAAIQGGSASSDY
jgi:hypothetical protein